METVDGVKKSVVDLLAAFQMAKLYSTNHAIFKNAVEKAAESIAEVLRHRHELVIGFVGEEVVFEKEIFFDLISTAKPLTEYLKERGIEKITFSTGFGKEKLEAFFVFLANLSKDDPYVDPQQRLESLGIRSITVGKIKMGDAPGQRETGKQYAASGVSPQAYAAHLKLLSQSLDDIFESKDFDHVTLNTTISGLMENLFEWHQELSRLSAVQNHDTVTFLHMLNVSVLAMYFAFQLGFAREDIFNIGIAGLFHDIGKVYISRGVLGKHGALTDTEFTTIKTHSQLGARLLLGIVDKVGILPVIVAFEHHMRYDSKGYPKVSRGYKQHVASMIISICDVYDALMQRRSYKFAYPPDAIYKIMMKEKGAAFSDELLDVFFRIIGAWPLGTIVELNDDRVAVVRQVNQNDIFKPKIEVVHPKDKKEIIDLKENCEVIIQRALNPLSEGKQYVHLI